MHTRLMTFFPTTMLPPGANPITMLMSSVR